jgi:hypothetical protein
VTQICTLLSRDGHIVIIALYIDDMLFTSSSTNLIISTKCLLETNFEMSDIGDGTIVLYLKAECIHVPQGIFMPQRGYYK